MEPIRKSSRARKPSARLQLATATEPEIDATTNGNGSGGNDGDLQGRGAHNRASDAKRPSRSSKGKASSSKSGKARAGLEEDAARQTRSSNSRPTTAATASTSTSRAKSAKRSTASKSPIKPSFNAEQDTLYDDANGHAMTASVPEEEPTRGNAVYMPEREQWGDWQGSGAERDGHMGTGNAVAGPSRYSYPRSGAVEYQEHRRRSSPFPAEIDYDQGGYLNRRPTAQPYYQQSTESRYDYTSYESRSTYIPYRSTSHFPYELTRTYGDFGHSTRPASVTGPDAAYPYLASSRSRYQQPPDPDPAHPHFGDLNQHQRHPKAYASYAGPTPLHVSQMEEERQRYHQRTAVHNELAYPPAMPQLPPHLAPRQYYSTSHLDEFRSEPGEAAYTGRPARPPASAMPAHRPSLGSEVPWLAPDRSYVYDAQSRIAPVDRTQFRFWRDHTTSEKQIEPAASEEPIRRTSGRLSIDDLVQPTVPFQPLHFSHSKSPSPYHEPSSVDDRGTFYTAEEPNAQRFSPSPQRHSPGRQRDDQLSASNEALSMLLAACEHSDYTATFDLSEPPTSHGLTNAVPSPSLERPVDLVPLAEPEIADKPQQPKPTRPSRRKGEAGKASQKAGSLSGSKRSKRFSGADIRDVSLQSPTVEGQDVSDEPAPNRFNETDDHLGAIATIDPQPALAEQAARVVEAIIDSTDVDAQFTTSPVATTKLPAPSDTTTEVDHNPASALETQQEQSLDVAAPLPDGNAVTEPVETLQTPLMSVADGPVEAATVELRESTANGDHAVAVKSALPISLVSSQAYPSSSGQATDALAATQLASEEVALGQPDILPDTSKSGSLQTATTRPSRSLNTKKPVPTPIATPSARSMRHSARLSGVQPATPKASTDAEAASSEPAPIEPAILPSGDDEAPSVGDAQPETSPLVVAPAAAADIAETLHVAEKPDAITAHSSDSAVITTDLSLPPAVASDPVVSPKAAATANGLEAPVESSLLIASSTQLTNSSSDTPRPLRPRKQAVGPRSPRPVRAARARPSASAPSQPTDADTTSVSEAIFHRARSMSSNLTSIDDERSPSPALPVIGKQDPETGPTAQERFTDGPEPVSIPADQLSGPLASLYDFRPVIKLLPVSATSSDAVQQVEMQKCKRKGLPLSASSQRLQAMLASTGVPKDTPKPTEANGNRRPARMRRAAGGGAVGVRDVEDIIIDWLDRYGETEQAPPADLPLTFSFSHAEESIPIAVTVATALPVAPVADIIDVPDVLPYDEAADDRWQATQEIELRRWTGVRDQGVKTHKRGRGGELPPDPSPDEHFIALHKKFEIIERKQQAREKETLQHERYKMTTKVDLLKGMSDGAWETVLVAVLSRSPPSQAHERGWEKARKAIIRRGVDWLRDLLIQEGEEVLERYNQLLPPEPRNRTPTPLPPRESTSPERSASPLPPTKSRHIGRPAHVVENDADAASPAPMPRRGRPPRSDSSMPKQNKRIHEDDTASPWPNKKRSSGGKPLLPPLPAPSLQTTMTRTSSRRSRLAIETTAESSDDEEGRLIAPIPIRIVANGRVSRQLKLTDVVPRAAGGGTGVSPAPATAAGVTAPSESRQGTPRIRLIVKKDPQSVSRPDSVVNGMILATEIESQLAQEPSGGERAVDLAQPTSFDAPTRKRMSTRSTSPRKSVLAAGDRPLKGDIGSILASGTQQAPEEAGDESDRSKEALEVDAAL